MARIFLMPDGRSGKPLEHPVPIAVVIEKLTPFEKRYFDAPPDFGHEPGAHSSDAYPEHLVVQVGEAEIGGPFPEAGYYYVPHLDAGDARALFGMPGPASR